MSWTDRRRAFRALLAGPACVHPGSVYDPVSARLAEDLGFEAGMFAGSIAALAVLGSPDLVVLTLTEFAEQIRRMSRATSRLPLLVDADHGYGNALSVMRTVQELEQAGVAALTIEDTVLPRPYGDGATRLLSCEEGLGKIKAALAARSDPSLVIVARTSAVSVTGLDDAVARARRYADAGADAVFFTGVTSCDQLEAIRAEVKRPLILGGSEIDPAGLAGLGVRVALQGHQPFLAAVRAVHETLKALRDGVSPKNLKGLASSELTGRVTRDKDVKARSADFLGLRK